MGAPARRGSTPLHFAANAKSNTLEVCQLLLSLGADPEVSAGQESASGSPPPLVGQKPGSLPSLTRRWGRAQAADFAGRVPYELASSDAVRLLLGGPDPRCAQHPLTLRS